MNCRALLMCFALVVPLPATAAGPIILNGPMPLTESWVSPTKPEGPFAPAPTPNNDITAPRENGKPVPGEPALGASIGPRVKTPTHGEAFGPGGRFTDDLLQRNRTPGYNSIIPKLELTIPFEK